MIFNSFNFAIFFFIFCAIYFSVSHKKQNILILVSSYIFYGSWNWKFLLLLAGTTYIDYIIAILIEKSNDKYRKPLLVISIISSVGTLALFKYFDFFAINFQDLFQALGLNLSISTLNLILPVGISFYTLHTLGYIFDVYNKKEKAVTSPIDFGCFVSFFPLLVAGPIVRISTLRDQLENPRIITTLKIESGMYLILIGLIQKVVIADNLSTLVNHCFSDPGARTRTELILGMLAFTFQIYGDFAGYSNMAIGISRILGFTLPVNFNYPYFSIGFRDFWRRWHISLSTWLRDYLYIPLGGSKNGKTRRNILITMGVCGMWHGASLPMLLWGGYHGILISIERYFDNFYFLKTNNKAISLIRNCLLGLLTFICISFGWLLFRSKDIGHFRDYVLGLTNSMFSPLTSQLYIASILMLLLVLIDVLGVLNKKPEFFMEWSIKYKALSVSLLLATLFLMGGMVSVPFIYFQF